MESYESKHSDHSFTGKLAAKLGVTQRPLRLDSQAKYGELITCRRWAFCCRCSLLASLNQWK